MKKESKAYSYEDQKWEVEMRQEMLRKKRVESDQSSDVRELLKKAKLSQKQKVCFVAYFLPPTPAVCAVTCVIPPQLTMETQLAVEEATRARLNQLSQKLSFLVQLLEALTGEVLVPHGPRLSHVTRHAFTSPLAGSYCRRIWRALVTAVFQEWTLGRCGHVTVMYCPYRSCDMSVAMETVFVAQLFAETSIRTLTSGTTPPTMMRVFSLLSGHTPETSDLSSAGHTLTLPLLEHVLMSQDNKVVSHDLRENAVEILGHAIKRYNTAAAVKVSAEV